MKRCLIFIFLILCSKIYASQVTDGLIAYYQFNGDASSSIQDSYGNNDGSFIGSPTNPYTEDNFKESLLLNGTNQYFRVEDNLNLDFSTALTIICWVKPTTLSSGRAFVSKWTSGDGQNRNYGISDYNGAVSADINTNINGVNTLYLNSALAANIWQQVAMTYDAASQTLTAYLNNSAYSFSTSSTVQGSLYNGNSPLLVGALLPAGWYYSGYIDEVKLFNRALSSPEILQEYDYVVNELGTVSNQVPEPLTLSLLVSACCGIFLRKLSS
ncbi:MAG: LamG domain-containing protein [Candidatus Auribacter fodinae]|jgi:hypothetical protein|uniref:LamG domain-containing protein n=1 Tax=Candidatus Auribacter fodinae TaxID=2093366 RepID=A0A3A4R543_9BACT|nr:MAG: LamG domain-containing protein [Candidatus Auribacter fodinae]